jgi:hypothetical protein
MSSREVLEIRRQPNAAGFTDQQWRDASRLIRRTIRSSLHCSIASTNPDGTAHVTPIGSLLLTQYGSGVYFDAFNVRLAANVDRDPHVSILAVDSSPLMWVRSLAGGRFVRPPGIRLIGTVGPARPSTPAEADRFRRLVGPLMRTRGGQMLWGSLPVARDVKIDRIEPIGLGAMTASIPG